MRATTLGTALLIIGFALGHAAAADLTGTLRKISETDKVVIGFRESSVPFSYLDGEQKPVGFAIEICGRIVEAVKATLKRQALAVEYVPVTAATRIALLTNGTIDLECGSTTNNPERHTQVDFTNTHFLTATRFASKKSSRLHTIEDLRGKTVVSTSGTNNIRHLVDANVARKLGITVLTAKDHGEAFLLVETDRAVAVVLDDVLLASFVASAKDPDLYELSTDAFSLPEPYGIMLRKDDAPFKALADAATSALYSGPDGQALYARWFLAPIPPRGINLRLAMDDAMRRTFAKPRDSADPASY